MKPRHTSSEGFTLIELLVTVAIVAIIATIAFPSMANLLDRHRLVNQVRGIAELLQTARSEAMRRSAGTPTGVVSVTISPGASWYVGLSNSQTGCATQAACTINQAGTSVAKVWTSSGSDGCSMVSPTAQTVVVFNFTGMILGGTNQQITLQSPRHLQLTATISPIGRISLCSPGGAVIGYPSC